MSCTVQILIAGLQVPEYGDGNGSVDALFLAVRDRKQLFLGCRVGNGDELPMLKIPRRWGAARSFKRDGRIS